MIREYFTHRELLSLVYFVDEEVLTKTTLNSFGFLVSDTARNYHHSCPSRYPHDYRYPLR
jgi:hypothetical protein